MSGFEYSIITEIKKSDKSNVYLASVTGHEYPVIVKEIQHGNIQVFEALKEIDSEYLPKIYHVEKIEDGLLVVEEYVDGELLADHLVLREITEAECIDIAEQICAALEVLHSHKPAIIHRDIKPSNIIITPNGKVKLIDYDSSRLYKEESESDTWLLGTENYAAPEQFGYSQTDCRSDIYSLGVVLRRFKEFLKPAVIKKWEKIVEKCTLFSPDSRYQHVSEVKDKLRKIRKSIGTKYKMGIAVFVMLLILVVPVIVYLITRKDRQSTTLLQSTTSTIERLTTEISTKETTTTELETTEELTTEAPTTDIPTTEAPTTEVSTTETPTTEVPTTENVTMDSVTDMPIVRLKEEILSGNEAYPDKIYAIQEGNNPKIAALKKYICDNNALVLYHIKQRMSQRNFYYQVKELQAEECTLSGLKLISENDGSVYIIEDKDYEVVNSVIIISKDYMNSLRDGFYTLRAEITKGNNQIYGVCTYVKVAQNSTVLESQSSYTQFSPNIEYQRGSNKNIQIVLRNYGDLPMSQLWTVIPVEDWEGPDEAVQDLGMDFGDAGIWLPGDMPLDQSMYKLDYYGRLLEISSEYIESMSESEYYIISVTTLGSPIYIKIKYYD